VLPLQFAITYYMIYIIYGLETRLSCHNRFYCNQRDAKLVIFDSQDPKKFFMSVLTIKPDFRFVLIY
jgi:hypothetical protein